MIVCIYNDFIYRFKWFREIVKFVIKYFNKIIIKKKIKIWLIGYKYIFNENEYIIFFYCLGNFLCIFIRFLFCGYKI